MPNADGIVELDSSCMHGPKKRSQAPSRPSREYGTPSLVAKAVMDHTDHHLLVGDGAKQFARAMGFSVEDDLNTENSRKLWREWKRRIDPGFIWLDPDGDARKPIPEHQKDPGGQPARSRESRRLDGARRSDQGRQLRGSDQLRRHRPERRHSAASPPRAGSPGRFLGRTGDSPILGAGLVRRQRDRRRAARPAAAKRTSTTCRPFLIVESMRRGMSPKDAGMEALKRIQANTIEKRLLNGKGNPNFNIRFFVLNKKGEYAGVSMYRAGRRSMPCAPRTAPAPWSSNRCCLEALKTQPEGSIKM